MKKLIVCFTLLVCLNSYAKEAFGKPGITGNWTSAAKTNVGTSYGTKESLVWFTNVDGILSEVYYPRIDTPQIKDAQLLVTSKDEFWQEKTDTHHSVEVVKPWLAKMVNSDPSKKFKISHTYFTLQNKSTLVDIVDFEAYEDGLNLYLLVNSHLENSSKHDNVKVVDDYIVFYEGSTQLKITSNVGFSANSAGYVGRSDGFQDLFMDRTMDYHFSSAHDGNVASTSKINIPTKKGKYRFVLFYDFSNSEINKLKKTPIEFELNNYESAWLDYINKLRVPTKLEQKHKLLYLRSLYTIKTHEDKLTPGALAASLSIPWGEKVVDDGHKHGGYHLVWPRDLFHKMLALLVSGDFKTPEAALSFLKHIQFKDGVWNYGERKINRRGAFPQNVWTNGDTYWTGFQIDQTGFPIQLYYHLYTKGTSEVRERIQRKYFGMVMMALEFIYNNGPWSAQERWEENFGISPSSFAVATRALFMGTELTGDDKYAKRAQKWLTNPGDNIHTWTFTKNGPFGDGQYYVRVSGCDTFIGVWNPNIYQSCHIANSNRRQDQRKMMDQGFLKLALQGLVPATDWRLNHSLEILNKQVSVLTPNGRGWYRYSNDAYGENGKGRLWPLLSSEHGRFYIEKYADGGLSWNAAQRKVDVILDSYLGFANDGLMIPEQVFESTGEGTGAATPLAWSHAEYIKLLWSKELKKNVENP